VSVVCCQVEVPATGRLLVQRSPTEVVCVRVRVCVRASECGGEASIMRRPWPNRGSCALEENSSSYRSR
jgi:hypothetical protein